MRLDETSSGQSASKNLTFWRDENGQAEIITALAADQAGQFQPTNGRIAFGIDKLPHWFRLDLYRPPTAKDVWWIELPNPHINNVQVYIPTATGYVKQYEVGDHQVFDHRPMLHRYFIFPVSLPIGQAETLYF